MASRRSAKSVPVSCTEPDEVCGTKSEECSDLDLASFADSEGNAIMWVPECDDCVKLVGGMGFPRHPSKEMKVSLLKPKFWFSDVIDAFFVSVAHSVTKHSTKVQVLPMCGTYEHQLNSLFERITERDVHYFAPFYDDSAGFHFFLVHFFGDSMIVSDCEMDKNSYLFRDLRKSTTKFLSPVCKRYKKKMGHTLKVSYSTDHFLMSSKKGDQVHCSANVCANLLLSLSLKSSYIALCHNEVCKYLRAKISYLRAKNLGITKKNLGNSEVFTKYYLVSTRMHNISVLFTEISANLVILCKTQKYFKHTEIRTQHIFLVQSQIYDTSSLYLQNTEI